MAAVTGILLAFAAGIVPFAAYSYDVAPIYCDGIQDDAGVSFLCALPSDETIDFSKRAALWVAIPDKKIASASVERPSSRTTSGLLAFRQQHSSPLRRLLSTAQRASEHSSTDPH